MLKTLTGFGYLKHGLFSFVNACQQNEGLIFWLTNWAMHGLIGNTNT